ncbi:MAG: DUF6599 family protein [Vicinamibacterales bacterium]
MTDLLKAFALVCLAAGTALAQDPMPADAAVPGWKRAGNVRVFKEADLYGHIDGGAELFLEFGFEQLAVQKYRRGSDEISVEVYRMTDPTAAVGIYLMKAGAKETGDNAFPERHTVNRHQLMFQRNRWFIVVNNLGGAETVRPSMLKFAATMAASLPRTAAIPELALLPKAGLVPGSVRLHRGPYALQAVYTLGDGDILQLGRRLTAVSGEYRTAAGTWTEIAANYPDPGAARKALAHLQANLDEYLQVVGKSQSGFVFQDHRKLFGSAKVGGTRLEIRLKMQEPPASP